MREAMAAVRAACGEDFIVGIKLPADERVPGGIDPDEAERIARAAAAEGVLDYLSFSQGAFGPAFDTHLPDMHYPPRPFLPLHTRLRAAGGGLPVIGLGRIESAEAAETALAESACDMVGFSRLLISDADWPRKTEGRARRRHPRMHLLQLLLGRDSRGQAHPLLPESRAGECGGGRLAAAAGRTSASGSWWWVPGLAGLESRVGRGGARPRGHGVLGECAKPGGAARVEALLPGRTEVATTAEVPTAQRRQWRG